MQLVTNTQVPINLQDKALLSYLPRRQSLDLSFRDICYKVLAISLNKRPEMKQILHGVSGDFQAGQLTAILGPSGAGKSTLLNILAGYTERGVSGTVRVNGVNREASRFSRQACYIMQENELRPLLTARESMSYAARLKLGGGRQALSSKALDLQINEILETLGLIEHADTRAGQLSGGQRRRLSIALELLNNPPIMFLDEPTTGLDSASCAQCVELLRFLARGGRTVVITIHQPSARLFERFDQLYTVADGRCIYRGAPQGLVPFLAARGLPCPPYHNPADFLLEVACGEHGDHGLADFVSRQVSPAQSPVRAASLENHDRLQELQALHGDIPTFQLDRVYEDDEKILRIQASLFVQFLLLYVRNLHVLKRDYKSLTVRLACHISIALLFGYLYRGVGSDAEGALANWVYVYGTCLFLMYTGKMAVMLSFPLELNCLTREHFNRWYSLGPYLASILCVEIPFQIVSALCYLGISYWMTGQPMETSRAAPFFGLCVLISLTAQGFGFLIGATLPVTIAVFIGPTTGVLLSIFGFCIVWRDTPYLFRWLFHISYFRAAFQAAVYAVYGNNRGTLECKELYCHFRYPHKFLAEMDIPPDVDMLANAGFVTAWGLIMHIATYIALWIRLNKR